MADRVYLAPLGAVADYLRYDDVKMAQAVEAVVAELVGLREATDRIRRFAETEIANGYPMLFAEEVLAILDGDPK